LSHYDHPLTALQNFSGNKTGRSPKDKRIVYEDSSKNDIWWGPVNIKMDEHTFEINRERAIDYLNTRDTVYVFDGFAGVSYIFPFMPFRYISMLSAL
jgi:phosphoenolpyruvate carboxykinase (ATP)